MRVIVPHETKMTVLEPQNLFREKLFVKPFRVGELVGKKIINQPSRYPKFESAQAYTP